MIRFACLALLALSAPLSAKESLGVFSSWGAFRDPEGPRCYAIAMAEPSTLAREFQPFASVGTWPKRNLRGQLNFRLSRELLKGSSMSLQIGGKSFKLNGGGSDAWAQDPAMDAAVVAAMRSSPHMTVRATDSKGRRFSNTYALKGAASAMDAATVACARRSPPRRK